MNKKEEKKVKIETCDFCGKERVASQTFFSDKTEKTPHICYMCVMGCTNSIFNAVANGVTEAEKHYKVGESKNGDNKKPKAAVVRKIDEADGKPE